MAIELEDALEEAYKLNPIEYRWKKYEVDAPEVDDKFKWNFMREIKQPQLEIKGPSVGSLLYALNPQTSELGLKQMESELNQQLQANEMFDKRGEQALDFMEKRVQEDIAKKKLQNVDAGHANSLLANYTKAIQSGDATAIAIAEDRIRKTFPNADIILEQAKSQATLNMKQKERGRELAAKMPIADGWKNIGERDAKVKEFEEAQKKGEIDLATLNDLIKQAYSIKDQEAERRNTYRQAYNTAGAGKSVKRSQTKSRDAWIENYMKQTGRDRAYATRAYNKEFGE